jgi:hypothetical protein
MRFSLYSLVLVLFGCISNGDQKTDTSKRIDTIPVNSVQPERRKDIRDFMSDTLYYVWSPEHKTTKWLCEMRLRSDFVTLSFHGQCDYDFFTYYTSDSTIDMLWSFRGDCISDMDFVTRPAGISKRPKTGDIFATYTLTNDTTISATYYYPELVNRANKTAGDSLFGRKYYLRNPRGI